ncbi:hypothetical protein FACS189490_04610 [Clostridia bacterium]|nr:hypothetical protein FACS189490_04610 [Clostridia bacterium]
MSADERQERARTLRDRAYTALDKIAYARTPAETFAYTAEVAMIYSALIPTAKARPTMVMR